MTQLNFYGAGVLLEDTPANRENIRRLLAHWRSYFDQGPGVSTDLQVWARDLHHQLIEGKAVG